MTTTIFSAAPFNTGDTYFRAWGSGFSAGLAAIGFVKTADTGQIDWGTVIAPVSNGQQKGYEVWRFNDSLQASTPLFFRVGYGAAPSHVPSPGIYFTIGKGSDGAGNITGVLNAMQASYVSVTTAINATVSNWFMSSGDGSMLTFAPALAAIDAVSTAKWWFSLDRSRDVSGAPTNKGIWSAHNYAAQVSGMGVNYASAAFNETYSVPVVLPGRTSVPDSLASGGKAPLASPVVTDGVGNFWQPRSVLIGKRADVGVGSPITVTGYGTYLPTGGASNSCDGSSGTYSCACLGWW